LCIEVNICICFCLSGQLITSKFIFNTDRLSPIFHLVCITWCRFMFLTHFGNKSQNLWRWKYTSCM